VVSELRTALPSDGKPPLPESRSMIEPMPETTASSTTFVTLPAGATPATRSATGEPPVVPLTEVTEATLPGATAAT
jgi:hypothetical protein